MTATGTAHGIYHQGQCGPTESKDLEIFCHNVVDQPFQQHHDDR